MSARSVVVSSQNQSPNPFKEDLRDTTLPTVSALDKIIQAVPQKEMPSLTDDFVSKGFALLRENSLKEFGAQLVTPYSVDKECVSAVGARLQAAVRVLSQSVLALLEPAASGLTERRIESTLRHGCFQINLCSLACFWQGIGTPTPPQWTAVVDKALHNYPVFETPALQEHLKDILQERVKKFYVDLPGFKLQSAGLGRDFMTLEYVGAEGVQGEQGTPTCE
jgi:hypothetical protein